MFHRLSKAVMTVFFVLAVLILWHTEARAQLAPEYMRNGECYLLIGEGPAALKGVYRLNNPEKNLFYNPAKHLFTPNNSFSFAADLNRNIYTFTEQVESGFSLLGSKLKRQVLDGVAARHADYGYHTWIHYDHRSWGVNTNVYRVGPVGRNIQANSGTWGRFKSAGPGSAIPAPSGNPLPSFTGSLALDKYGAHNWYEIPNGSWYSSWKTGNAVGSYNTFYVVFGDKEEGKAHNWKLFTWAPNNINLDAPVYTSNSGNTVAVSYDKKITRQVLAGCLDGCGGAAGSGSGVADAMTNDLAFMPPIKSQSARTYFYSRPKDKSGYEITLNGVTYNPEADNPLIGLPDSTDTEWIGVSMRNVNTDYVYTLGNSVIKSWYKQVTGANAPSMKISAVAVSNQWNQEGGVVYAYDQSGKMIYKFTRKEKSGTPISSERYQALSMSSILSAIGAKSNSVIDDIKADGFGSLYFGMSHPSKTVEEYDPRQFFKPDDAFYLRADTTPNPLDGTLGGNLLYIQEYAKVVFARNVYDGAVEEMGRKNFAVRYYNVSFKILAAGMAELIAAGTMPHNGTEKILASWSAVIGNNDKKWDWKDYSYGTAGVPGFVEYTYADPGRTRLSVINVPTPPKVISLAGKKSFLDIVGPYLNTIPMPDTTNRSTNQGDGLIKPTPTTLAPDKLYFYMVENYPLPDGAQDPTSQPDWDNDGRQGGFVTSMANPESSTKAGGRVYYRWRTWLVEDLYGHPVCKPMQDKPSKPMPGDVPPIPTTGMNHYYYFYSPVPGKYIMTCQVIYDWYDYDLLKFGDTIDDLDDVLRQKERALPVQNTTIAQELTIKALEKIMANEKAFAFMTASSDTYISAICEGNDNTFAVIPLVVTGLVATPTDTLEVARIQRCDVIPSLEPGKTYLNNNAFWHPQTTPQPTGGFHGIEAGKSYYWRMDIASQTNLFFDVSKSNVITNPADTTKFNYVASKLLDNQGLTAGGIERNQFYVNRKPEFQFRNLGGDVRWVVNSKIRVTAHLEYKVPKAGGGFEVQKKFLIQDVTKPGEPMEVTVKPEATVFSVNKPIVTETGGDLPPTDPTEATLVITMRRMFEYDMWINIWNGTSWNWGSYITLPKDMVLESKTTVKIIDMQKPRILFSETSPINLFGETGELLKVGVGPTGKGNPDTVKVAFSDNNPWEAVDAEFGITSKATYDANRLHNVTTQNSVKSLIAAQKPTGNLNLKPVFAKAINRKVRLAFETSSRDSAGRYLKKRAAHDFDKLYSHFFSITGAGAIVENNQRLQKDQQSFSETQSNGNVLYYAKVSYKLPLNFISLGAGDSLKIPTGYANNTPGYHDKSANIIKPYLFYMAITDSSGNMLDETPLNLALHVRDNLPPNPYGLITELKDETVSYFPLKLKVARSAGALTKNYEQYSFKNLTNTTFDEAFDDRSANWTPDATPDGYINGKVGYYQSLKSMGDSIVAPFKDEAYSKQIDNVAAANPLSFLPPRYMEDNVEAVFQVGVSDNAGIATATLTYKYFDATSTEKSRSITSGWASTSLSGTNDKVASYTNKAIAVFRGKTEQFPMAIPVKIVATDDARDWDYYTGGSISDPLNQWSDWKWGAVKFGAKQALTRTYKTSMPVFGSNLIIRTIDKTIRNQ